MDASRQAKWEDWALGIARGVVLESASVVAEAIKSKTDPLQGRIAELERRAEALEARLNGGAEVVEWPLPKGRAA